MQTHDPLDIVEIPLSKTKMALTLAGSAVLVAAGIWVMSNAHKFGSSHLLIITIGIVCTVFFGVVALYIVSKLFDARPGMIIDNDGLTDNSSMFAVGFVPWEDVLGFNVVNVASQKFIMVLVDDPDGYIRRQPNALARRTASLNYKMYGSPVAVTSNALKTKFDDLYNVLKERRPNL
ncbi:hypothetical protein FPZ42_15855 [Mucilaginibacter achroorhodeus]|uniref:PH domain-containing protein n=1 Tax=Mucilaginibacter achroorhodeus TaxID=2599294 RepID=A0A563U146_9SPHI|nr:STM3941 family protein [Mucilaginibacter achroorhodeus]TWR24571.1 hypothetical protein FPZ42_15855 [Mucilaginibacter achroorhodeus]